MTEQAFTMDTDSVDIVIVGGGIVGLCFANALIGSDFSVLIIERRELTTDIEALCAENQPDAKPGFRVSAINRSALKQFKQIGIFDLPGSKKALAKRLCVFDKMFVWDQTGAGQIQFDSAELGVSELGAIVENDVLQLLLLENIKAAENITYLCPQEITCIEYKPDENNPEHQTTTLSLSSGRKILTNYWLVPMALTRRSARWHPSSEADMLISS